MVASEFAGRRRTWMTDDQETSLDVPNLRSLFRIFGGAGDEEFGLRSAFRTFEVVYGSMDGSPDYQKRLFSAFKDFFKAQEMTDPYDSVIMVSSENQVRMVNPNLLEESWITMPRKNGQKEEF